MPEILFLVATVLIFGLFLNLSTKLSRNGIVSYELDCKDFTVKIVANDGYVLPILLRNTANLIYQIFASLPPTIPPLELS